jgi:hypothetical protein
MHHVNCDSLSKQSRQVLPGVNAWNASTSHVYVTHALSMVRDWARNCARTSPDVWIARHACSCVFVTWRHQFVCTTGLCCTLRVARSDLLLAGSILLHAGETKAQAAEARIFFSSFRWWRMSTETLGDGLQAALTIFRARNNSARKHNTHRRF